ncbi:darcynin [Burkholderia sp. Ac-20344]|nr:darcynin [Burkholderia sp. Ac-20344]
MPRQTAPPLTVFMLLKTRLEWLGFPAPERLRLLRNHIAPIRKTHGERVSPRLYDTRFYSARMIDVWIRDAQDRHTCELAIDARRERPFRDRDVGIVAILPGVENASASNDDEVALFAVEVHAARRRRACAAFAQSFFLHRPPTRTTVATCGTTVVVRDSTVTLWA